MNQKTSDPPLSYQGVRTRSSALVGIIAVVMGTMAAKGANEPIHLGDQICQEIPFVEDVAIDGKGDDWQGKGHAIEAFVDLREFYYIPKNYLGAPDFGKSVRLGWDNQGILLWVEVVDDAGVLGPDSQLYLGDCVDLFVADKRGVDQYTQVVFAPDSAPQGEMAHWFFHRATVGEQGTQQQVEAAAIRLPERYALEVRVPWTTLGIEPVKGREFGMQVQLGDRDPGEAQVTTGWYPVLNTYRNPKSMFRARLVGSTRNSSSLVAIPWRDTLNRFGIEVDGPANLTGKTVVAHVGKDKVGTAPLRKIEGRSRGNVLFERPVGMHDVVKLSIGRSVVGYHEITDTTAGRDLTEAESKLEGDLLWPTMLPDSFVQHTVPETLWNRGRRTVGNGLNRAMKNVQTPRIVWFHPSKDQPRSDAAVLMFPGGGLERLSFESSLVLADTLNNHGVTAVLVIYRTCPLQRDVDSLMYAAILADARRAVRVARHRADGLGIDPQKIGVLGGSAGASLIMSLALDPEGGRGPKPDHIDSLECYPNFLCLLSGGTHYEPDQLKGYPPTFIVHALDDGIVGPRGSIKLLGDLFEAGVTAEAHIYSIGGHSLGGDFPSRSVSTWMDSFVAWLGDIGMVTRE